MSRLLPEAWLPAGRLVERVIVHWTAGAHMPSVLDKAHYHFLVTGHGEVVRGIRGPGLYLPHTRGLNTGSVGLAICAMAGAVQQPAKSGPYPITRVQWERCAQAAAEILHAYKLPLTESTLLTHSEVTGVYGILQRGKWDINVLPFARELTPEEVHRNLRRKAQWYRDTYL